MNIGFMDMFRKVPLADKVNDEHHQAQLDLLAAQASQEYWNAMVPMLEARVKRLAIAKEDAGVAGNVARLRQKGEAR